MEQIPNDIKEIITTSGSDRIKKITGAVLAGKRISREDALLLAYGASLPLLSVLSSECKRNAASDVVYFNRNFHIEPTNKCVYNCRFCSYHKPAEDPECWDLTKDEMLDIVRKFEHSPVTEVHITGGVHPKHDITYYADLIKEIKELRPDISVKAYSAVELDYMIKKAGMSYHEGLAFLKQSGLDSIPGGGAEIFDDKLRSIICGEKIDAATYLTIHEEAHKLGIPSNATMLYGHSETWEQRIDHMFMLRELQDRTHGFKAFIPLKFRNENNSMSYLPEVSVTEDMRNFAISRIFLDNFTHLKAYWPALGRDSAVMSLAFGVDDLDGTIDDTTRIYSMAGSEETTPSMTSAGIAELIRSAGLKPVERDTNYRSLKEW
jgi:aminodeoxyfutalosine synthase